MISRSRVLTALSLTFVLVVAGCKADRRGPEPVVERFIRSINDKDLNVLLTCVDPRQERLFRASFRIVERFTGGRLPVTDLLELVPGLYQIFQNNLDSDYHIRDFQVYRANINGEKAEVPVRFTTSVRNAGNVTDEPVRLRFRLERFEEGWRIVGINNPDPAH